tara:strand:- start:1278 stop:1754 length:477 start_codon:yes stop_codon:yes gene_type:complete
MSMNEHYIKNIDENNLYEHLKEYCNEYKDPIDSKKEKIIKTSLTFLKNKAKTLEDIYNNSKFILQDNVIINNEDKNLLDINSINIIKIFIEKIKKIELFNKESIEPIVNNLIKENSTNFKNVGQPLRICLTGSKFGPGIYDILSALGKDEVIKRLSKV